MQTLKVVLVLGLVWSILYNFDHYEIKSKLMFTVYLAKIVHADANTESLWVTLKELGIMINFYARRFLNLFSSTPVCFLNILKIWKKNDAY